MTQTSIPKTTDEFLKVIKSGDFKYSNIFQDYYKLNYKTIKQEVEELIQIHCYSSLLDLINQLDDDEIMEQFCKYWDRSYEKQNFKNLLDVIKNKRICLDSQYIPLFEKEFEQLDKYHQILRIIKQRIEIKERELTQKSAELTKTLITILITMPIVLFVLFALSSFIFFVYCAL